MNDELGGGIAGQLRATGRAPSLQMISPIFNDLPEPLRRAAYVYRRDVEIPWNRGTTGETAQVPSALPVHSVLTTIDGLVTAIARVLDDQTRTEWNVPLAELRESLIRARNAVR